MFRTVKTWLGVALVQLSVAVVARVTRWTDTPVAGHRRGAQQRVSHEAGAGVVARAQSGDTGRRGTAGRRTALAETAVVPGQTSAAL